MNALFLAGVFVVAVIIDLGLMAWYRRRLHRKGLYPKADESGAFILGGYLHPRPGYDQQSQPSITSIGSLDD